MQVKICAVSENILQYLYDFSDWYTNDFLNILLLTMYYTDKRKRNQISGAAQRGYQNPRYIYHKLLISDIQYWHLVKLKSELSYSTYI